MFYSIYSPLYLFKRTTKYFYCGVMGILLSFTGYAQADSLKILSLKELIGIVKLYHPVVKQATLETQRANYMITEARGSFDPMLTSDFERKRFSNELYYSYYHPELTIPTWYGVELKAGLENISGNKTANELTLGETSYLGIKVPLGKDMLLDKRRAVLQQAKAFQQQTLAQQQLAVNDILFESVASYYEWTKAYYIFDVLTEAVQVNRQRLRFIVLEYEQGNRAAIDTTEAYTQLQAFELLQAQAWLDFQNEGLMLSNYLWLQNNQPLLWSTAIVPDTTALETIGIKMPVLEQIIDLALLEHPKLKTYQFKLDILEIERRLKVQSLFPKLDLKANLLNKGYNVVKGVDAAFLQENYKFGVNFQMPLFLREARGALNQTKIKQQQTGFDQQYARLQIENKIKTYYNELVNLKKQLTIAEAAYENYFRLFRGEEIRFKEGESTLFLLNARENKLLESKQKVLELKAKLLKSNTGIYWAGGQLR